MDVRGPAFQSFGHPLPQPTISASGPIPGFASDANFRSSAPPFLAFYPLGPLCHCSVSLPHCSALLFLLLFLLLPLPFPLTISRLIIIWPSPNSTYPLPFPFLSFLFFLLSPKHKTQEQVKKAPLSLPCLFSLLSPPFPSFFIPFRSLLFCSLLFPSRSFPLFLSLLSLFSFFLTPHLSTIHFQFRLRAHSPLPIPNRTSPPYSFLCVMPSCFFLSSLPVSSRLFSTRPDSRLSTLEAKQTKPKLYLSLFEPSATIAFLFFSLPFVFR